jgi:DNA invertase Pin-like site-specific DNA recombinase
MQGFAGLGMAAQRIAVAEYIASVQGRLLASYEEVETARPNHLRNRPQLVNAIAHARRSGALLVIARLDRLSRSVLVTAQLHQSGLEFVCCDNPHANSLTIQILAVMAEYESKIISERAKAAYRARKARGIVFKPKKPLSVENRRKGQAAAQIANRQRAHEECVDLVPIVRDCVQRSYSLQQVANYLNEAGHTNRRGNSWSKGNIQKLLQREGIPQAPRRYYPIPIGIQRVGVHAAGKARLARAIPVLAAVLDGIANKLSFRAIAERLNADGGCTEAGTPWAQHSVSHLAARYGILKSGSPHGWREGPRRGTRGAANITEAFRTREYYAPVIPLIKELQALGYSQDRIATVLNSLGHRTQTLGPWSQTSVWRVMSREAAWVKKESGKD